MAFQITREGFCPPDGACWDWEWIQHHCWDSKEWGWAPAADHWYQSEMVPMGNYLITQLEQFWQHHQLRSSNNKRERIYCHENILLLGWGRAGRVFLNSLGVRTKKKTNQTSESLGADERQVNRAAERSVIRRTRLCQPGNLQQRNAAWDGLNTDWKNYGMTN